MEIVHELNDSNINIFSDWYFFKFNKEGGKASVLLKAGDQYAIVSIKDSGTGMSLTVSNLSELSYIQFSGIAPLCLTTL